MRLKNPDTAVVAEVDGFTAAAAAVGLGCEPLISRWESRLRSVAVLRLNLVTASGSRVHTVIPRVLTSTITAFLAWRCRQARPSLPLAAIAPVKDLGFVGICFAFRSHFSSVNFSCDRAIQLRTQPELLLPLAV